MVVSARRLGAIARLTPRVSAAAKNPVFAGWRTPRQATTGSNSRGETLGEIRLLVDSKNNLGQGPVLDVREQYLYWVDCTAAEIWSCRDDGSNVRVIICLLTSARSLCANGDAVLALASGFASDDFGVPGTRSCRKPLAGKPDYRFNDGKVDRAITFLKAA